MSDSEHDHNPDSIETVDADGYGETQPASPEDVEKAAVEAEDLEQQAQSDTSPES